MLLSQREHVPATSPYSTEFVIGAEKFAGCRVVYLSDQELAEIKDGRNPFAVAAARYQLRRRRDERRARWLAQGRHGD
jgi:hypothetical protein